MLKTPVLTDSTEELAVQEEMKMRQKPISKSCRLEEIMFKLKKVSIIV